MLTVPKHYSAVDVDVPPYKRARVVERGGTIVEVKITLPAERTFTPKFGKKVKKLGGSYSECRGDSVYWRYVHFPWGTEEAATLIEAIVRHFWGTGDDVVWFVTEGGEDYGVRLSKQGTPAEEMVKKVAQNIAGECNNPDNWKWYSREEAQAFIDKRKEEYEQAEQARVLRQETLRELVQAFNDAGFPTETKVGISFDVKTSKELISLLRQGMLKKKVIGKPHG